MPFASVELTARIERAEARLIASATARVRARGRASAFVREFAGGVACYAEPDAPLDKVAGAGFAAVPDDVAFAALERAFDDVGCPVRFELATLADPALAATLTRRGYALESFEHVLGIDLPARDLPAPPADLTVEPVEPSAFEAWLDVLVTGFAAPDAQGVGPDETYDDTALRRIVTDFAGADGMELFLARRGGEPVGAGSMRVAQGLAQLCGSATLAAHRRRGVQTALLSHRLTLAAERGCDLAVVTTQPGSKSQQNAWRRGFALLYARAVLVRPTASERDEFPRPS
ncbi:MAG: GNAT family N-acetyltransferase [Planctomycetota bacterium]